MLLSSSNLPEPSSVNFDTTMFHRLSMFLLWAVVLFPAFALAQQSNATSSYRLHSIPSLARGVTDFLPPQTAPKKFGILLFPGFEPLDVFGPAEVIQTLSRRRPLSLYLIPNTNATDSLEAVSTQPRSAAMNPYNSTAFQSIVPTHTLATVPDDLEVLLVPGGLGTRAPDLNATIDWVRATYPKLHSIISVCTGGSIVARAGVFDGRRATTNKVSWNQTIAYGSNVTWDKMARWVHDGNVWSSGGVSAGIDVTFGFVADTWGEDVARSTANLIEYEWRNDPNWDVFGYVW